MMTYGEKKTFLFMVLHLEGQSIQDLLGDRKLSPAKSIIFAYRSFKCLEALHQMNIVHRDIKHGNFILSGSNNGRILIMDFGLSQIHNKTAAQNRTKTDELVGTREFYSLAAHQQLTQTFKDDTEAVLYVLEYLSSETFAFSSDDTLEEIQKKKESWRMSGKFFDQLPAKMKDVLKLVDGTPPGDIPNYNAIYNVFITAAASLANGFDLEGVGFFPGDDALLKAQKKFNKTIAKDEGERSKSKSRKRSQSKSKSRH
uniref:Protein kinase domain-containing protein n=1 Tax=Panagrolaimus sp. ES5 TaxID=591445 RepID=A0AC34FH04_9BILA